MSILTMHHGLMAGIKKGGGNTVVIGGRAYKTVTIGEQTWMAENLDYKWDGLQIPGAAYSPDSIGGWYYDNDETVYGIDGQRHCGLLYTWPAAMFIHNNRETICPGWHLPSKSEFEILKNSVGGDASKLRISSLSWAEDYEGTDDFGFSAIPGGRCSNGASFDSLGSNLRLWSATSYNSSNRYFMSIEKTSTIGTSNSDWSASGLSVRLVKDA